ncbi:Nucleosome assembly protein (NAP) protein [Dioscorea alata]|uniref:Nucleosome assembly protein (NAP) protein n=1 Tax=Dioscorea alata TaxID=55571 RepID=A0ACB7W7J0_DIOAL|nr:Nucleosome assembly protein (NAP) protein [Dioscorea alata]
MVAAADKGKRSKVEDAVESSDPVDGELVLAIEKLQEVQDELEKISEEASDKVLEVEQKYSEIRKPIYSKRNEIIQSIPDFWLTAFLSHPALSDLLNKEDEKILKHLVSLDVDHSDVKAGYSITFNFSPNPYFEDTKLTKSFSYSDEGTTSVTGTIIKWKEGMNIANGVAHEKKGKKRPIAEQSFFSWFGETQDKSPSSMIFDEVIIFELRGTLDILFCLFNSCVSVSILVLIGILRIPSLYGVLLNKLLFSADFLLGEIIPY